MKGSWLVVGFIIAFSIFFTSAWPDVHRWLDSHGATDQGQRGDYSRATVEFSEIVVDASVPLTSAKEQQGLAGRTGLGSREGMLFVFDQPGRDPFWMNGMLIPLDFIWLSKNQVVDITANVPPPQPGQTELPIYRPEVQAASMLEVMGGFTAEHQIKVGDAVRIDSH
jgi:uncharacterized membrane protein (UPF0127 family)